ncbi:LysR family transcriptional regulator [Clostridium sp. SHJSY1]|uniref:LysR family transcriptional regulator n=1 Tax=Clostridium sp. SHJSY1 TaxID=2942483 RepID=UPI002875EAE7|nr:LysR family transcriptional regulator [Clostridium sp. SHJSY1]MDS0527474.1 LysR family transcriptional regulator [Clostridium sp. SHJSY1]
MNIKDLKFFLQICKDKSIRKAAKPLYITPQGLSKSLKNLEDELQFQLFYRTTNGLILTEYGEIVKKHAEYILSDVEGMHSELINSNNALQEELVISCAYGVINALSPEFLLKYQKANPNIKLKIIEYPDLLVDKAISEENFILGLTLGPINTDKFDYIHLQKHNLNLLVNIKNPLSKKDTISFEDLKNETFILFNKNFKTHNIIVEKCNHFGFSPNISFDISEISSAYKLCHMDYGISFTVDYINSDIKFDNVLYLPLEDTTCTWDVYLITKKGSYLSHSTKNFINYIKMWFMNLSE